MEQDFRYVRNILGDVEYLLDSQGKVVAEYYYDIWGNSMLVRDFTGYGEINPFRYRGYYYDTESRLYYLITRYYDPRLGVFLTRDSTEYLEPEEVGGVDLYAYCLNNPVMYVDPDGTWLDTVLDLFFILWDMYDLCTNDGYTKWENWAALGVDLLFAAIPFVTGGGQVVKLGNKIDNVKDVASMINRFDKLHDVGKAALIGRNMNRVKDTAKFLDRSVNLFSVWKGYDREAKGIKMFLQNGVVWGQNSLWIYGKLRRGFTIIDVGISTAHKGVGVYYGMERFMVAVWETRNAWKALLHYFI